MVRQSSPQVDRFYWIIPILAWIPQLLMTLNSFSQVRFEEFITSVQAPFWFYHHLIQSGLHVNVGWYAFLVIIYEFFGFSLFTGRFAYLFLDFISLFILAYLLKQFFKPIIAAIILITFALSPTWLFINSLNMHMAFVYHILFIVLLILVKLDFSKKLLSQGLTAILFFLIMVCVLTYQAAIAFVPSLFIFYWLKYRAHPGGVRAHPRGVGLASVAVLAFLLPVMMLFFWVENRQMLIWDSDRETGLFRGGGQVEFSEEVFSQNWTHLVSDLFIRGVSGHYEVKLAEFSLIFPLLTLAFVFWLSISDLRYLRNLKYLAFLVMGVNLLIFSGTNALVLVGMNRVTPILLSIYFLWVVVWWGVERGEIRGIGPTSLKLRGVKGIWVIRGILGLFLVHHLIVYPANLAAIKEPSPFKVTDWFDSENPQKSIEQFISQAQKQDLLLDCRPIVDEGGGCFYDFIYPSVAGSCEWNNLECHNILGYDGRTSQFIPLSIDLWQEKYWEE